MSSTTIKPPSGGKVNRIGLPMADYKGGDSTLCAGCGHDAITSQIVRAFWEYGVEPHRLAKLSGIGCSSKTPAYFLNQSHGINAVHGRMPAVGTGAVLGNKDLIALGVSGDGDSASAQLTWRDRNPFAEEIFDGWRRLATEVFGLVEAWFANTASPSRNEAEGG